MYPDTLFKTVIGGIQTSVAQVKYNENHELLMSLMSFFILQGDS